MRYLENTSPSSIRAKKAFQSSETAPSGASSVIDRAPIWNTLPRIFEVMKMAKPSSHSLNQNVQGVSMLELVSC